MTASPAEEGPLGRPPPEGGPGGAPGAPPGEGGPLRGPLRVIVVDDELPARRELERILARLEGVELAGSFGVARLAEAAILQGGIDLVLLDIRMPGESGLALAARIANLDPAPRLAFVTAHEEHALEAFEREAIDYILKPPAPDRVARLVERVRSKAASLPDPEALARTLATPAAPLLVGTRAGSARRALLRPGDLLYATAADELVFLVTEAGRWLSGRTLAQLEGELAAHRFLRTHRAFLVNLDRARAVEPDASGTWMLHLDAPGHAVPVSRRGWAAVKRLCLPPPRPAPEKP